MSAILAFEKPGKPVLRGIEHFWTVIRELDQSGAWTAREVYGRSNARDFSTVRDFIRRLVAAGMAVQAGSTILTPNRQSSPLFRLQGPKPLRAPRLRRDGSSAAGTGQQSMWNVMRGPLGRDGFTVHDLALWGSTDLVAVSKGAAKSYVKHLSAAGYFVLVKPAKGPIPAAYKLKPAMNTGPRPPMILRAQVVVDQNRMAAVGAIEAEEVAS